MRTVKVHCVHLSPLLMDKMSDEAFTGLETGVRPQEVKDRPAEEKAVGKIYRDNGKIGLPAEMLISALKLAGAQVKNGKRNITKTTTGETTLFDFLTVQDSFLPFLNIKKEDGAWTVDKRKGIGRQAKVPTAVCIIRPRFDKWEFTTTIQFDERKVNEDTVRKLFEVAGSNQGLGSFRPNKGGPFGRFRIAEWKDVTDETNI